MRKLIYLEQIQYLSYVMDMSDTDVGEKVNCTRVGVTKARKRFGLVPKGTKEFPKCSCGTRLRFLSDEGVYFCSNCLTRVNARGEVVDDKLKRVS